MVRIFRRLSFLAFLLVSVGLIPACNFPASSTAPVVSTEALFTQAAQTIIARLTKTAPPAEITPKSPPTELPVGTLPPAATQTPQPEMTSTGAETPIPTPTVEKTAVVTSTVTEAPAEILFEEDFEQGTGWHTDQNDSFGFEFVDGGYRIYVNIINAPVWSIREMDEVDVRLEVDASRTAGPDSGYYGLVCRHRDEDNYYALVISPDGTFGIAKNEDGEFNFLEEGITPANVIHGGNEVNRVRADCIGDRLTLYANGQNLAEIQDDDFDSGDVGLIAGTRGQEGLEALFDNFAAYK
jgi:hypothetical protein